MIAALRLPLPRLFALSACVLVAASSCLSPGTLDEEAFRLKSQGQASDAGSFSEPGCAEGCAILTAKCATADCHQKSNPAGDLSLEADGLVERLSNQPAQTGACGGERLLVPGSPSQSVLYTKLLEKPSCGLRMPLGGALPAEEIDCIARWVLAPSCGESPAPRVDAGREAAPAAPPAPPDGGSPPVTQPEAAPVAPEAPATGGDETVWLEAESAATLIDPMAVASDPTASASSVISAAAGSVKVDAPDGATTGIASFLFDVAAGGTYTVFGRVFATVAEDDSFWVRVDDGRWIKWNNLPKGSWTWDDVHDSDQLDAVVTFPLTAGAHAVSVMYREAGGKLDKLAITNVSGFVPEGLGQ